MYTLTLSEILIGHLTFYVIFESKVSAIQNSCLYKSTNVLLKFHMLFNFKMTGMPSTDDTIVKVPSFQNVTYNPTI